MLKTEELTFPRAIHDEEDTLKVYLVKNKNEGHVIFNNLSAFDFFLVLSGSTATLVNERLLSQYKSSNTISVINSIDIKKLKKINNYIF